MKALVTIEIEGVVSVTVVGLVRDGESYGSCASRTFAGALRELQDQLVLIGRQRLDTVRDDGSAAAAEVELADSLPGGGATAPTEEAQ